MVRRTPGVCNVTYSLIGIGGFLGANARYLIGGWFALRYSPSFPYGTLVINVSGSLAISFVLVLTPELSLLIPTGASSS